MNNLHRELAPISDAAWEQIEDEARRTFTRNIAGRRVVDLVGPAGPTLSAVGTGHIRAAESPVDGVLAHQRDVRPIVEFRAPFTVTREGHQIGELIPIRRRRRFVSRQEFAAMSRNAPVSELDAFRADQDAAADHGDSDPYER